MTNIIKKVSGPGTLLCQAGMFSDGLKWLQLYQNVKEQQLAPLYLICQLTKRSNLVIGELHVQATHNRILNISIFMELYEQFDHSC